MNYSDRFSLTNLFPRKSRVLPIQSHKPRADLKSRTVKRVEMQSCIRNRYFFTAISLCDLGSPIKVEYVFTTCFYHKCYPTFLLRIVTIGF